MTKKNKRKSRSQKILLQAMTATMVAGVLVPGVVAELPNYSQEASADEVDMTKLKEAAEKAVEQAEKYKRETYIDRAQKAIDQLDVGSQTSLQARLNAVSEGIAAAALEKVVKNATAKVEQAEKYKRETYIVNAQKAVDELPAGSEKTVLNERLQALTLGGGLEVAKDLADATKKLESAEKYKRDTYFISAQAAIDKLPAGDVKSGLQKRLDTAVKVAKKEAQDKALVDATKKVEAAEESKRDAQITSAQKAVDALIASDGKTALQKRLAAVKSGVQQETVAKQVKDATDKVKAAETSKRDTSITAAQKAVDALPAGADKTALQKRLTTLKSDSQKAETDKVVEAVTNKVVQAEKVKRDSYVKSAQKAVDGMADSEAKRKLNDRLAKLESALAYEKERDIEFAFLISTVGNATEQKALTKTYKALVQMEDDRVALGVNYRHMQNGKLALAPELTEKQMMQLLKQHIHAIAKGQNPEKHDPNGTGLPFTAEEKKAEEAVERAEEQKTVSRLRSAKALVEKLVDGPTKNNFEERLAIVESSLE